MPVFERYVVLASCTDTARQSNALPVFALCIVSKAASRWNELLYVEWGWTLTHSLTIVSSSSIRQDIARSIKSAVLRRLGVCDPQCPGTPGCPKIRPLKSTAWFLSTLFHLHLLFKQAPGHTRTTKYKTILEITAYAFILPSFNPPVELIK